MRSKNVLAILLSMWMVLGIGCNTEKVINEEVQESALSMIRTLVHDQDLKGVDLYTELGRMNIEGDGLEVNPYLGKRWLRHAAEQLNVKAMYLLSCYLFYGIGVEKDLSEAYFWLVFMDRTVNLFDRQEGIDSYEHRSFADEVGTVIEKELSAREIREIEEEVTKRYRGFMINRFWGSFFGYKAAYLAYEQIHDSVAGYTSEDVYRDYPNMLNRRCWTYEAIGDPPDFFVYKATLNRLSSFNPWSGLIIYDNRWGHFSGSLTGIFSYINETYHPDEMSYVIEELEHNLDSDY